MSCRGLIVSRQLVLFSLGLWVSRCVQVGRRLHSIYDKSPPQLVKQLWFAIDEIVHHNDVMLFVVVRPGCNVTGLDAHSCDACVVKDNAEEGQAVGVRRGRDEAGEYQVTVFVEVLEPGAGAPAAWGVYVCKDCAEAAHGCWLKTISTRYEEQTFGDIAAHRSE